MKSEPKQTPKMKIPLNFKKQQNPPEILILYK